MSQEIKPGGYSRHTLKVGGDIQLPTFEITGYNMKDETVTIVFRQTPPVEYIVPFCFHPLNISPYGSQGYMQPELLPFDHVGFIMDRTKSNKVRHRRSNEEKQLTFDKEFELNGAFSLISTDTAEIKDYVSLPWTHKSLTSHLDALKGTAVKNHKCKIFALWDEKKYHNSVLVSKITTDRFHVFVLFENGVVFPFKLSTLIY